MPEPVKRPLEGAYHCPEALPILLIGYYSDLSKQRMLQQEIDDLQDGKLTPVRKISEMHNGRV